MTEKPTMIMLLKKLTLLVMLLASSHPFVSKAQSDTIYVNELGASMPKEKASYYRIMLPKDSHDVEVNEYYLNHKLHFNGHFTNAQAIIKHGYFVYYNLDGYKSNEGKFTNGFKDGEWIYYYDEGRKIEERQLYSYPKKGYYDIQNDVSTGDRLREGMIDANEKKSGVWIEYFKSSDTVKLKLNYDAGYKTGEQLEYYPSGQLKRHEMIVNKKVKKGELFDEQGKKLHYYPAFAYPLPPESLWKYLILRVKCFDAEIRKADFEVEIKVLKDGSVFDVKIPDLMNDECKKEIINTLKQMRKWSPAKLENKPIDYTYKGSIKYTIRNE